MKLYENGVLIPSDTYLHTISESAQKLYFYPLCLGHYFCNEDYFVNRANYDSYLVIYVKKGSGYVHLNDRKTPLEEGGAVLLDCYHPHRYGTDVGWEILWLHFDGLLAKDYYQAIVQNGNQIVSPSSLSSIPRNLFKIYDMYHRLHRVSEPVINKYIVSILTDFLTVHKNSPDNQPNIIEEVLAYITENISQPITLEQLAKRASLSPFYFTRLFKRETGYTPHEYLLTSRVNMAKFYLKTTSLPVKEITFLCGFSSECNFCTAFKRVTGFTPLSYRSKALGI